MRTYKSSQPTAEKPRKRMSKKGLHAIAISASVVLVAVALTLSLTLGLRAGDKTPTENDVPVVVPPVVEELKFVAPLAECTVKKAAALDKLVYNDTLKQWRTHNGVDFEAAAGSDVLAIEAGKIESVENTILEGVVITLTHKDGYTSIYKGLAAANVAAGDEVESGKVIGTVGSMMCEQNSGAHLHLEMKKDGKYVAATDYIELDAEK